MPIALRAILIAGLCLGFADGLCHRPGLPGEGLANRTLRAEDRVSDQPTDSTAKPFPLPTTIDARRYEQHVRTLASPEFEGRGTPRGKQLAREYLIAEFKRLKLKPLFAEDQFTQDVPGVRAEDGTLPIIGQNLGAVLYGSHPDLHEEIILLSAHYDHLGIRHDEVYPGADDNATGVAMLLEVARTLAEQPRSPRRTVVFVAFDLEERLLWGSTWFAAHPPIELKQVKLFLTADMLGRSLGDLPMQMLFVMGAELSAGLGAVIREQSQIPGLEIAQIGADLVGTRSDYGPFRDRQIPFLFFSSGEHPNYHTPEDTPERVNFPKAIRSTELIRRVVAFTANSPDELPRWSTPAERKRDGQQGLDEVRTVYRITELLMQRDEQQRQTGKGGLSDLQRLLVSNIHLRTKQILHTGKFDPAERGWLIRSAQLLLATVF